MRDKLLVLALAAALIVGLVVQLATATKENRMTVYVVPAITDQKILPTTAISPDYISSQISIVASPGEYEPASFVVKPQEDIASLAVAATNLTGASGSIAATNIDIRVVKCWYQSGDRAPEFGRGTKTLTPELLLHDDSLVKVEGGKNYLKLTTGKYVWISEASDDAPLYTPTITEMPVKDSATLQPVNISAGENKQFWITVKVPDNSVPGVYSGQIQLSTAAGSVGELALEVEVLPMELSQSYLTYALVYGGRLATQGTISGGNKNSEQFSAEMADLAAHGMLNPTLYEYLNSRLGEALTIRSEAGIDNSDLYLATSIEYLGYDPDDPTDPVALETLRQNVLALIKYTKPYGVTQLYITGLGEVQGTELTNQRAAWEVVRSTGAKIWAFGDTGVNFPLMGDIQDLAVCAGKPSADEAADWHSVGHKIWCYANPQAGWERPETYRRNYGLLLWQKDYDGASGCAYQWDLGGIWNDFDSDWRGHVFAYPTMNGVIDTIEWEGWREGADDTRYLTTLLNAIKQAKAAGKNTAAVETWLANLKSSSLTLKDLDGIRAEMVSRILSLVQLGSSSDITSPVISAVANSRIGNWPSTTTTITWTTNERTTSQVEYGTTTGLGLSTALDTNLERKHKVTLTGLKTNTTYYFRVNSKDASGNLATSATYSLSTSSSLSISFTTPSDANGAVVNRNWTEISTTVSSTYETTSFIDWNRSLVGYWDFNEASGSTANDRSTYGNNAALKNSPQWTTGKFGSALRFTSNYVDAGDGASLNMSKRSITVECRFYLESLDQWCALLGKGDYGIYLNSYDGWEKAYFKMWDPAAGASCSLISNSTFEPGSWYHIAFTYDYSTGIWHWYINGRDDATGIKAGLDVHWNSADNLLFSSLLNFKGSIDDARIWKRALSPEEIGASYSTKTSTLFHRFTNLADGTYNYYAYVTNAAGSATQTETRTITITDAVDTLAPAAPSLVSPANGTTINSSSTLDWSDVTDASGVTYQLGLYNTSWSLLQWKTGLTSSAYAVSSFGSLAEGTYYWRVRAVDGAGNTSAFSSSCAFQLDNTDGQPGDANADGIINTADLTLLERIIAGLDAATSYADANQDGKINTADLTTVETIIAGIG